MKIEPTCRYGHGDLQRIPDEPENHRYALMGTHIPVRKFPIQLGAQLGVATPSGRIYSVAAFRCATCGYLELFDDEGDSVSPPVAP